MSTLEKVLEHLFNGPNDELIELVNDPANQTIIDEKNDDATGLDDYLQDLYEPHFTDDVYQHFTGVYPWNINYMRMKLIIK